MKRLNRGVVLYVIIILGVILTITTLMNGNEQPKEFDLKEFTQALDAGEIKEMTMEPKNKIMRITGELEKDKRPFITQIPDNNDIVARVSTTAEEQGIIKFAEEEQPSALVSMLTVAVPFILIGLIFFIIFTRAQGGGGGGGGKMMNFGKSKAKLYTEEETKVRFADVAGADEEKQELMEVVDFLKDPRKYQDLGARIPKGVLLIGPPGTGKTLLAKAVAGEAGTPFFSISGSDFVEMFVGVGASRVRDLFENAKKNAPAIIFIDEIDAVGRQRGAGVGGGHDEREQTLNQLLVEMDGFADNENIIMIAATNRPDILDPALLRPGRFDRQIPVNNPDVSGRQAILKVHARNKNLLPDVNLKVIAMRTPGFSGADLENLLNEAAIVAARHEKKSISMLEIDEAIDRVIAGPAKRSRVVSEKERQIVAYHESGHTIIGMVLDDADTVHKVTIVPRGQAGGYAVMLPKEDRFINTKPELLDKITGLLGGRVAEEIIFGKDHVSTGASNDFERATAIANKMITEFGMSEKIGATQFTSNGGEVFLGRDMQNESSYSDAIAHQIDIETQKFINFCYDRAKEILTKHKTQLETVAKKLLEVETLDAEEIKSLFDHGVMPEPVETSEEVEETETPSATETVTDIKPNDLEKESDDSNEEINNLSDKPLDESPSEKESDEDPEKKD
ncbi:MAG TPA: ATP-dependent zinc metalloprotease FtsH [Pseudogracilibacillus sp.]|nr:ATP-dependent zinc metalloprotease FtsH [Pseudogracilibacillus sp.]